MADKVRFARLINERLAALERSAAWLAKTVGTSEVNVGRWRDESQSTMPRNPALVHALAAALQMSQAQERDFFDAAGLVFGAADKPAETGGQPRIPTDRPTLDPGVVAAYLEVIRTQCSLAETRPYHQLSEIRGAPQRLSLLGEGGVYVPLRFDLQSARDEMEARLEEALESGKQAKRRGSKPDAPKSDIDLADVLVEPGHVIFVGAAGSGKTTILRLAAAVLAMQDRELARSLLGLAVEPFPLPVYVALREFEHACNTEPVAHQRTVEGLLRFMDKYFARWHPEHVPEGFVSGLVRSGRAWLLLDALDEIADFDHRVTMRQVIERLAETCPGSRLLVTARVAAYANASVHLNEQFRLATVRDLRREQWAAMIEQLYGGLEVDPDAAAERSRRLLERIDASPLLQEMVKTPLMVWTATLIHFTRRELPEQRAELYSAYVDVLLGERLHEEEGAEAAQRLREERWSKEDRLFYLTYAAYQVHRGAEAEPTSRSRDGLVTVDEDDLVTRILAPKMMENMMLPGDQRQQRRQAEKVARDFVAFMAERSGLLTACPEGYTFGDHLTVQEYLAAKYLVDNVRVTPDEWRSFLQQHTGQSWWQEVYLLMAGYLLEKSEQARRFLLLELGDLAGEGDVRAYGLAWAGRALLEIPGQRVVWRNGARDELARRLLQVLWHNPPAASIAARVEAGDVLGRLGDPRFSGPCGLPEFIPIPAGRFWMGSDEAEVARLQAADEEISVTDETPRHEVELDAFGLARYPTTNTMFRRFMEVGGYDDKRWWAEAIADGLWAKGKVRDGIGDKQDRPAYRDDVRLNSPSQPVVGLTWYEAAAYCRWLTATVDDGCLYRLPTEAEWERAARGPVGRRYPWGDTWQPDRCNSAALGLERTTPVGIFPDGASQEGVLDLSGNVWEWCSDWYADDTYGRSAGKVVRNPAGPQKGDYRISRGGSSYNDRKLVRCAYRSWAYPDDRSVHVGFRVARGVLR